MKPVAWCSFCGKNDLEVQEIIKTSEVAICDECVVICVGIIKEHRKVSEKASANFHYGSMGEYL